MTLTESGSLSGRRRDGTGRSPQSAAHRISELKRFLYLRISGVSLCGRMLVGLTLTTEILRASFSLACSCLSSSLANMAGEGRGDVGLGV